MKIKRNTLLSAYMHFLFLQEYMQSSEQWQGMRRDRPDTYHALGKNLETGVELIEEVEARHGDKIYLGLCDYMYITLSHKALKWYAKKINKTII